MFTFETPKCNNPKAIVLVTPKEDEKEKHFYKFVILADGTIELDTYFEFDKTVGIPYRVVNSYRSWTDAGNIGISDVPFIHQESEKDHMLKLIKDAMTAGVNWGI